MMSLFDLPSASVQSGKDNEWQDLTRNQVICGDALVELRNLSSDSIDALCVDPPAAVSFMSRSWDGDKGGRTQWVAWLAEIMRECLRVMKPGAHGLVWALPRTSHWTAWALEDAGFEVRDCLYHLVSGDAKLAAFVESLSDEQRNAFAQLVDSQDEQVTSTLAIFGAGFPKSHNISIAIDRYFKAEREVTGISPNARPAHKLGGMAFDKAVGKEEHSTIKLTEPATPEAQKYAGWGSNLKPAVENWYLVRKPLSEKSIAENVLKWGTGGLNIDACRINYQDDTDKENAKPQGRNGIRGDVSWGTGGMFIPGREQAFHQHSSGRWPSHLLISHSLWCDESGCDAACPVRLLDEQSGVRKSGGRIAHIGDTVNRHDELFGSRIQPTEYALERSDGGASRYFQQFYYCPKASRKDRTANNTVENNHPTVKPLNLIQYLCRMICPPGGIVLDCFAGSGTTALACISEGFDYLLIEQELEYVNIAKKRIDQMLQEVNNAS